ncbi:MAG: AraC family transcriptional regulator [Flavobacteriales bacterium]|nr:AraC family transcriptional regulator [Flavobacteriales bacterium]
MAAQSRDRAQFNADLKLKGFNVFQIEADGAATRTYSRKDFYKICLTTGTSRIHYADRTFEQEGTVLFFGNPHIPYSWETLTSRYVGYTCLFSEDFLKAGDRTDSVLRSPLFKLGGTPILKITEEQRTFLNGLFQRMLTEQDSDYAHKDELIRNYIHLIVHEALKMTPSEQVDERHNAASRITNVFMETLERQFPIESVERPLELRTPQDYAQALSVHVNSLNRAVKSVTGKPTGAHIAERVITEARALLEHTDWNVSEVAYALGFEYPSYFNSYFKRITGTNPQALRAAAV